MVRRIPAGDQNNATKEQNVPKRWTKIDFQGKYTVHMYTVVIVPAF